MNKSIEAVEKLDSNAITNFAEQSQKIFEIIGPECARFADEEEKLDDKIQKKRAQQQHRITELGKKKGKFCIINATCQSRTFHYASGEVESIYHLIEMTEKHVAQTDDDLQDAKNRKAELNELNRQVEIAIQNIPTKIEKTLTVSGYFLWMPWRRTYTSQVDNCKY